MYYRKDRHGLKSHQGRTLLKERQTPALDYQFGQEFPA